MGQHTLNGFFHNQLRAFSQHLAIGGLLQTTWIPTVPGVHLLIKFSTGKDYLISINNNYMISGIYVGSESRGVFPTQNTSGLCGHATKGLTLSV